MPREFLERGKGCKPAGQTAAGVGTLSAETADFLNVITVTYKVLALHTLNNFNHSKSDSQRNLKYSDT